MKTISPKEKTIKKWTSSDSFRDNWDSIFNKNNPKVPEESTDKVKTNKKKEKNDDK